ncbi:uncharacterized protein BXIN_2427 [Babesia sp. Xinjiang]|uniref:uncharacterized protein n=1 Tax=Babesia sp. Xinjiang TaxID=462227 RepID=UPI000A245C64|nr:uncharacterized protein BXIN_2427 [Babesia sp. Xinjiang]ORM39889.1 hypothetical protein BXIN_2427 [Babesia sp. Xinjiang]
MLMADKCSCGNGQPHKEITCPPGNLKEAIDWILRVTNKDDKKNGGGGNGEKLGSEVAGLLQKAKDHITTLLKEAEKLPEDAKKAATEKLTKDKNVLTEVKQQLTSCQLITELADNLKQFIDGIKNGGTYESSSYKDATWDNQCNNNDHNTCASILLGALPVIFSGLSYLYWQCNKGNGPPGGGNNWSTQYIHDTNFSLGIYFVCCGYDLTKLNQNKKGQQVGETCFQEFTNGTANVTGDYSKYINTLLENTRKNAPGDATKHPLSSLYLASQYYFMYQQSKNPGDLNRVPCSIREMLYWLMALPYSECFQLAPATIKQGIKKHGEIVIIGMVVTLNLTDPFDCYLLTTCHYAGFILMTIQGKLCSPPKTPTTTDETTKPNPPNIHSIYDNSHFKFHYPHTVTDWFNKLWDVVYHLITQFYFLKEQCRTCFGAGCGWQWCQYGDGINSHMTKEVESWICTVTPGETHSSGSGGNHTSGCTESQQHIAACGKDNNPSPLQAFLCDLLIPFKCPKFVENKKYPPYTEHISHRNFNQYCPVPMGFNKDYLPSSPRTGHYIYEILNYFTQNKNHHISLYNIFICLICTGLRTPRTVGDLFGFFLYLGEKMNNGGSPKVADAIDTESKKIPWSNQSTPMTTAAHDLAGKTHIDDPSHHPADADLYTLHDSECAMSVTCGKYLDPLSFVIYCNVSVAFAETYLSRIIYLTHALKEGLKVLLTEFNNLTCEHCQSCDCKGKHTNNQHTTSCLCTTIVQCADVLPLFFKFGFTYYYAAALNGTEEFDSSKKRQCKDFAKQLQNVIINGGLFKKLLEEINKFLLCIRKPFLLYLLTFWLVAILYFSYGLTIPLDLFHIRSHWRRALSHQISVLALLSKKAMSPTKVGYFTP